MLYYNWNVRLWPKADLQNPLNSPIRTSAFGKSRRSAWDSQNRLAECPLYPCDFNRSMQHIA